MTKTVYYEVSCGLVVWWVLKATWTGVRILQALCVSCRQTGMACRGMALHPLLFQSRQAVGSSYLGYLQTTTQI